MAITVSRFFLSVLFGFIWSFIIRFAYNHTPEKWLQEWNASLEDPAFRSALRLDSLYRFTFLLGAVSLSFFFILAPDRDFLSASFLAVSLIPLSLLFLSDLLNRIIPHQYLFILLLTGLFDFFLKISSKDLGTFSSWRHILSDKFLGAAVCGLFFSALAFTLHLAKKENSFGGGDLKLIIVAGFYCGARGILPVTALSFFAAGLYSLPAFLYNKFRKRKNPETEKKHFADDPSYIPLAPFFCVFLFLYQLVEMNDPDPFWYLFFKM